MFRVKRDDFQKLISILAEKKMLILYICFFHPNLRWLNRLTIYISIVYPFIGRILFNSVHKINRYIMKDTILVYVYEHSSYRWLK